MGSKYESAASIIIPLIAAATFLRGLRVYYFDQSFQLTRKTYKSLRVTLISAIALVASCYTLIPLFGYIGAAYGSILSFGSALLLSRFLGKSDFEMPIPWTDTSKTMICTATMTIVAVFIEISQTPYINLLASAIAGVTIYTLASIILNVADLKQIFRKAVNIKP
ncbi:hypothetical protein D9M70_507110 [compost metagenome]